MYANKGLVKFSDLIKATINLDSPSKQVYKTLLSGLRESYLLSCVCKLGVGITPTFINKEEINNSFLYDFSWYQNGLRTRVDLFTSKYRDHSDL